MEFEKMINTIQLGDCLEVLKDIPNESIDMILTSPPYDELRNYKETLNWNFNIFKSVANELKRILKDGGVIIWVVGDQTKNSSESGTSFKQALYFKEIGLNLYDTMIYRKLNFLPLTHRRYEQEFEYMFCISKNIPKTFNPIMEKCTYAGKTSGGSVYKTDNDDRTNTGRYIVKDTKIKGNIFEYYTGSNPIVTNSTSKWQHPAMFPYELAKDQIISWTNENDIVLDPFCGSGTTCIVAKDCCRKFIGIEKVKKYYEMANNRVNYIESNGQISIFTDIEEIEKNEL